MTFQSSAKCAQALGNSLAVIEPVGTKDQLTTRKSIAQLLRFLRRRQRSAAGRCDAPSRARVSSYETNPAFMRHNVLGLN
jgi:hypothetical protein